LSALAYQYENDKWQDDRDYGAAQRNYQKAQQLRIRAAQLEQVLRTGLLF
jgi:hypothetical protein